MGPTERPGFGGCVLHGAISGDGSGEYAVQSVLIGYPEWREIAGRLFLIGRVPEISRNDWITGRDMAVAWDAISTFVVFRSGEEYRDSYGRYKPSLKERFIR